MMLGLESLGLARGSSRRLLAVREPCGKLASRGWEAPVTASDMSAAPQSLCLAVAKMFR